MMRTAALIALALLVGGTSAEARGFKLRSKSAGKVGRAALRAVAVATAGHDSAHATPAPGAQSVVAPASVASASEVKPSTPVAAVPAPTVTSGSVTPAPVSAPVIAGVEDTAPETILGDAEVPLPATLRENTYFYQSFGTADPFRSLLAGDFQPKQQELVDLHTVKMVGVVWEPDEIAAMVQDAQGFGYTLRPGDTVKNGSVVSVTQESLVARLNIFGQTTQLTLRLQHEE